MSTIIGIDPGQSGGIAILRDGTTEAYKMPETPRSIADFLEGFQGDSDTFAFLEKVHAMPRQGIASTAKFMRGVGVLDGILTAYEIPFDEVTPQRWQKEMGCMTKGDKNVSKRRAQQLFPMLKITHALADALLIAEYGRRVTAQRNGEPLEQPT